MNLFQLHHLLDNICPFRMTLLDMLSASEIGLLRVFLGVRLRDYERTKYMNPLRDLGAHEKLLSQALQNEQHVFLVGADVHLLKQRIISPHLYYKGHGFDYILRIWVLVLYSEHDMPDDSSETEHEETEIERTYPFVILGKPKDLDPSIAWLETFDRSNPTIRLVHYIIPHESEIRTFGSARSGSLSPWTIISSAGQPHKLLEHLIPVRNAEAVASYIEIRTSPFVIKSEKSSRTRFIMDNKGGSIMMYLKRRHQDPWTLLHLPGNLLSKAAELSKENRIEQPELDSTPPGIQSLGFYTHRQSGRSLM